MVFNYRIGSLKIYRNLIAKLLAILYVVYIYIYIFRPFGSYGMEVDWEKCKIFEYCTYMLLIIINPMFSLGKYKQKHRIVFKHPRDLNQIFFEKMSKR